MELFKSTPVSNHTVRISTPFGVSMFFVTGRDRSLLIDTGMGIGDLKSYAESLSDKPFDVVLTHGHCDHAGGAHSFEKVFLSPADIELEKVHASIEHRISDVFCGPFPVPEGISEKDFVPQRTEPYMVLDTDDVFDLGGVSVSFVPLPGHTHGCVVPLISEDGIMIIGDALGENTLMHFKESTSVETYRRSIERLLKIKDDYPLLLRFHGAGESDPAIIEDMYDLCQEIMEHRDAAVKDRMMGMPGCWGRKKEHPGKHGNMFYDPDKIFDRKGEIK